MCFLKRSRYLLTIPKDRYRGNVHHHGDFRPLALAVVLGLPLSFLLWAIVSFTVAIVAFNFGEGKSTSGTSDGVVAVLAALLFGILVLWFTLWYMFTAEASLSWSVKLLFRRIHVSLYYWLHPNATRVVNRMIGGRARETSSFNDNV